jgi:hypothetical protein
MRATETTFYALAVADGLELTQGSRMPWLTNRGHRHGLLEETVPGETLARLADMHVGLGGDERLLTAKRPGNDPRPDFLLPELQLLVEVDEIQHFTTDRLRTLNCYPATTSLAFDVGEYLSLVRRWAPVGDRYRAEKTAADFPFVGGRCAQRAYFDALRDLIAPYFGLQVLRIPAPQCDGRIAYSTFLQLLEGLGSGTSPVPMPRNRSTVAIG